jgi:hypothetical protein
MFLSLQSTTGSRSETDAASVLVLERVCELADEGNAFKLTQGTQHAGDMNGAGHANTARRAI